MSFTNDKSAYAHIARALDAAKAAGGGTIDFPNYTEAFRFQGKAYHYRKLLREESRIAAENFGTAISTPYDGMTIRFVTPRARSRDEPHTLSITFVPEVELVVKTFDGRVAVQEEPVSDLEEAALAFARRLE